MESFIRLVGDSGVTTVRSKYECNMVSVVLARKDVIHTTHVRLPHDCSRRSVRLNNALSRIGEQGRATEYWCVTRARVQAPENVTEAQFQSYSQTTSECLLHN
jgi:hypothetical protein